MAQEERLSDTPCSTLEGYGEGPQGAANGQDSWDFYKDAHDFKRLDAGSRAGFASSWPPPPWTSVFSIFLISVRERMLKICVRSSCDGQVESELLPTAGGIGPDSTAGISSPSTVATTGIFRWKGVDHGEGISCRRRRVGARGGTGLSMTTVKQQQLERSQGRPGPPVTGAVSETPATSTAIMASFDVFERMEACKREGTPRHADRSANDGDRVRRGFGSGDLRGARQKLGEGTQIGGRTAEHISSATLHAAHPLRDKSAQSPCESH